MAFFEDNIFTKYFPKWMDVEDIESNVPPHPSGKGILRRFMELFGRHLDTFSIPLLDNAVDNLVNVDTILDKFIPYMEQTLGVDLVLSEDLDTRRLVLRNFLRLTNLKGSKRGFESAIRLMRFSGLIIDIVEVNPYYDVNIPGPNRDCNTCWEFDIIITGSLVLIDFEVVIAIFNICEWNRPIKWIKRFIEYNCHQLSNQLLLFYFEDFFTGSENGFVDDQYILPPLVPVVFYDAEGNLIIDNLPDETYYEFDDIYFFNEGAVIYRRPSSYACETFDSQYPLDGTITTDGFTLTWTEPTDAVEYEIIVGTEMVDDANIVIDNRLVETTLPAPLSAYAVTGATDDTWYASQVKSDCGGDYGCVGYSPIRWTKTRKILAAPINLSILEIGSNHVAIDWDDVTGATGYRWDVATDAGFTALIHDDVIVNYGGSSAVAVLPSSGTYYFRVKAIHHLTETLMPVIESQGDDSATVIVVVP